MPEGGTTGRPMPTQEDYQAEVWKIFDHIDKVQADITEGTFWPEPERGSPLATDNRRTAPLHMGHSLQTLIVSGMIQERVAGEKSPAFENRKQWIDELITRHRITDLPWRFEISEVIKAVDAAIDATTHYEAYWRTASAFAHGRQWTQLNALVPPPRHPSPCRSASCIRVYASTRQAQVSPAATPASRRGRCRADRSAARSAAPTVRSRSARSAAPRTGWAASNRFSNGLLNGFSTGLSGHRVDERIVRGASRIRGCRGGVDTEKQFPRSSASPTTEGFTDPAHPRVNACRLRCNRRADGPQTGAGRGPGLVAQGNRFRVTDAHVEVNSSSSRSLDRALAWWITRSIRTATVW
jgi:hypothetical protein